MNRMSIISKHDVDVQIVLQPSTESIDGCLSPDSISHIVDCSVRLKGVTFIHILPNWTQL
jgi:hypothetical protein